MFANVQKPQYFSRSMWKCEWISGKLDEQTWMTQFDSGNFFVRGYLYLIQKESIYVKVGLPFQPLKFRC